MTAVRTLAALLGGTVVALASLIAPALAPGAAHPFYKAMNEEKTSPKDGPALFDDACGLAVDSNGRVFGSDYHRGMVRVLGGGAFAVADAGENSTCGLAFDSTGALYANYLHGRVAKFSPSGNPLGTIDSDRSTGVAVDPATDVVYVAHRTHISAYQPDGTPVMDGTEPLRVGLGTLGDGYGVAVSGFAATQGFLYVADAEDGVVEVYDPAADTVNPTATIDGSATPPGGFEGLSDATLAIDDSTGHLFVVDDPQPGSVRELAVVYEFDATGTYLGQLPRALVHGGPSGLAVDNSSGPKAGMVYVSSGNEVVFHPLTGLIEGSVVYAFCPTNPVEANLKAECQLRPPAHVLRIVAGGGGEGVARVLASPSIATLTVLDCGTLCATEYDNGTGVTLVATARPHSVFAGWSVSGQPGACTGTGTCTLTLTADTEVTASFTPIPQQTLTVAGSGAGEGVVSSAPVGISCGAACVAGFDQGAQVVLTAEAAPGSEFAGWSGAGCLGTGACVVSMNDAAEVGAAFRPVDRVESIAADNRSRILSISVTGSGAGTISSDPAGIECGTPCSVSYSPGARVVLTAKPDSESRFAGWSGCDSASADKCTVTLSQSKTVGAVFEEAPPLEVERVSLKGARATIAVALPSAGALTVTGRGLRSSRVTARKASTVSIPLALTKPARKELVRKGALKIEVTLSFKPKAGGAPTAATRRVTFKVPKPKPKKGRK